VRECKDNFCVTWGLTSTKMCVLFTKARSLVLARSLNVSHLSNYYRNVIVFVDSMLAKGFLDLDRHVRM